ncbi:MAG: hypothetical protein A3F13_07305 [Gammaproteobacteria bacterium RIFCSPHIGHO2_12_FULL_40_19]|nr:MAG: hypothetical protein A3F13_07305 [Gammaproteobacteria bacterium RIFCSPHIGHO2_12_FULL_40_19]
MTRLGYPSSEGLCHGVACVAAQYHLSHDMKSFHRRIKFTEKNARFSDTTPEDVRRFFDDIVIGQSPEEYPVIKNVTSTWKKNQGQNSIIALAAIQNTQITTQRGIKRIAHFTGAYSMLELRRYFDLLQESASATACTFALLIGSPLHAIMIGFDFMAKKWVFVDANRLPQRNFQYFNAARLALETNRALSSLKSGSTIFSTQLLTTRDAESAANNLLDQLNRDERWKKIHRVSERKAKMSDAFNSNWLMEACAIESEIDVVKSLIKKGANMGKMNQLNLSPLAYAIFRGNHPATKMLLRKGADANHPENTYLCLATENGFYDAAKDLLSHGAKINPGYPSPLFVAAEKGDARFIRLFKNHGVTTAGNSLDRFLSRKPRTKAIRSDVASPRCTY